MMEKQFFNRILRLLEERPQQGKRMLGLGAVALWELWQRIAALDAAAKQAQAQRPGRKRQAGGGRKKDAEVLCRLLVALLYLRQHWTMQALAASMGSCESTVWNYIHEMLPYIRKELPASLLEQRQQECDSVERAELEQWLAELPEGELLVDTWEQPIPRPQDNEVQEDYYSGKKKQHTLKNQVISLPKVLDIVDFVIGEKGPRHDGQLTVAQKAFNQQVSRKRVFVEHVIRTVKIFRIAKELFRMRPGMYEQVIGCVCGLVRLRGQYV